MSEISSREKGDRLEIKISNHLGINRTTNSGARYDNADLADRKVLIEAKYKDVPWFRPSKSEVQKLQAQALKHGKEWIYIQQNQAGTFVLLDLDSFIEMTEGYFEKDSKK